MEYSTRKKRCIFHSYLDQDEINPNFLDFKKLYGKKFIINDAESAEWTNIKITP